MVGGERESVCERERENGEENDKKGNWCLV